MIDEPFDPAANPPEWVEPVTEPVWSNDNLPPGADPLPSFEDGYEMSTTVDDRKVTGKNIVAPPTHQESAVVETGPPTHIKWRENSYELVTLDGFTDTANLTPIPPNFNGSWMLPDYQERTFTPDLLGAQAAKLAELAAIRWDRTRIFVYLDGLAWAEPAISNLTSKLFARQTLGITAPSSYKLFEGRFVDLDTAGMVAYGAAIDAYVQACFDVEQAITALILACRTVEEVEAIDLSTIAWP